MTKHIPLAGLATADLATTTVMAEILSTAQKLKIFIDALRQPDAQGMGVNRIEYVRTAAGDARSIRGTFLEEGVDALNAAGVPTGYTYGDVRRELGLDEKAAHWAFCNCGHVTAGVAAGRLEGPDPLA